MGLPFPRNSISLQQSCSLQHKRLRACSQVMHFVTGTKIWHAKASVATRPMLFLFIRNACTIDSSFNVVYSAAFGLGFLCLDASYFVHPSLASLVCSQVSYLYYSCCYPSLLNINPRSYFNHFTAKTCIYRLQGFLLKTLKFFCFSPYFNQSPIR